jgi:cytochrome c oxidase assembly protein subunit 15
VRTGTALRAFAALTTVALFLVVVLGFVDTATGSALGCGRSFPLCHGSLFPADNVNALIEWSHRTLSAVAGLMVGVTVVWSAVRRGTSLEMRLLGAIALGFVVVESVVGALAVLAPESQADIAAHLGIALTAFAALALLTRRLWAQDGLGPRARRARPPAGFAGWAWVLLGYMYVAVYVGAYVAGTGSGAACLSWPLCPGGHPTLSLANPVTVDLGHRFVALVGVGLAVRLLLLAPRVRPVRPDLARMVHATLGLFLLQVASGVAVVRTHLAIEVSILHVALATTLFTLVAAMAADTLPESAPRPRAGAAAA